ncbi:MAG TPA: YafY family protein [Pyrinomonadaceae bacterium]|nr:YafY family protein [Pyrinomonadaceae bacterium]
MRADRLLSILLLLQIHHRMTARELARRLEVSERTIHRDMEALGMAGVPIAAERGSHGGWMLMEGYETRLTGLNETEIQALFLTRPARLLADLSLDKASDAALIKLAAALPPVFRHDADYARQRIHVDVTGWNPRDEKVPALHMLQEAIWLERKVSFTYGQDECRNDRIVDPLGLVAKGSVWYLVASVDGVIRSYRVSRIEDAQMLEKPAMRPPSFDLAAFWEESSAKFKTHLPKYSATLRVKQAALPRLPYGGRFARVEKVHASGEDGWAKVSMRFQFEEEACEYVLSFGTQVEVIEPSELREKVVKMAKSVIDFYSAKSESG